MDTITASWLRNNGACRRQVKVFEAEWPQGFEVNETNFHRAIYLGLDVQWLTQYLLKEDWEQYKARLDKIWEEYWEEYEAEQGKTKERLKVDRAKAKERFEVDRARAWLKAVRMNIQDLTGEAPVPKFKLGDIVQHKPRGLAREGIRGRVTHVRQIGGVISYIMEWEEHQPWLFTAEDDLVKGE